MPITPETTMVGLQLSTFVTSTTTLLCQELKTIILGLTQVV